MSNMATSVGAYERAGCLKGGSAGNCLPDWAYPAPVELFQLQLPAGSLAPILYPSMTSSHVELTRHPSASVCPSRLVNGYHEPSAGRISDLRTAGSGRRADEGRKRMKQIIRCSGIVFVFGSAAGISDLGVNLVVRSTAPSSFLEECL